mgnify:CR=1 FL=1
MELRGGASTGDADAHHAYVHEGLLRGAVEFDALTVALRDADAYIRAQDEHIRGLRADLERAAREMARHRLRRLEFVGARRLPRAAQSLGRTGRGQPQLGDEAGLAAYRAAQRHGRGAGMRP